MANSRYIKYVMKSGAIIEVTDLGEYNGYRFDGAPGGKTLEDAEDAGRPRMHRLATEREEYYHIDQAEVAAIIFGPRSQPPGEKPQIGFGSR